MAKRPIIIRCSCCQLNRTAMDIDGEPSPTICGLCFEHRTVNHGARRAKEHGALLREALYAASKSAGDASDLRE